MLRAGGRWLWPRVRVRAPALREERQILACSLKRCCPRTCAVDKGSSAEALRVDEVATIGSPRWMRVAAVARDHPRVGAVRVHDYDLEHAALPRRAHGAARRHAALTCYIHIRDTGEVGFMKIMGRDSNKNELISWEEF